MGIARTSHAVFAVVLIGWGILGLVKGDFAAGWAPVPESLPGRHVLVYLTALVCVACGGAMRFGQTAALATRGLFFWFLAWLLLLRVPWIFVEFGVGTWWSASSTAVMTASVWVLYSSLANDWDQQHFGFIVGDKGVRIARALFGLGLIPIGLAHFIYLEATAPLVPAWMQWPVFWSYFTGGAFIVAGLAAITGVFARLGSTLVTLQIALLTLLVWTPRIAAGTMSAFQWGEVAVSIILTTCAWVVTDSYRSTPGFTVGLNSGGELA